MKKLAHQQIINGMATTNSINESLQHILNKRKEDALYRTLQQPVGLVDFCSNDYLSFARNPEIKKEVTDLSTQLNVLNGATGSRSISGNTAFAENLEKQLAAFHSAEAGLIFTSGYTANVGLFSCIAKKDDTIITDELIHASIIDGCRLSYAKRYRFAHNDTADLENKLSRATGNIFVAVESVYSMDGDIALLAEISSLCKKYNAALIVDEAHAIGVFGKNGRGLVNHFNLENEVWTRIYTFGKAMGCHGASITGSETLRNYLINFARSFIFTTALPMHSLINIQCAYHQLTGSNFSIAPLTELIHYFKNNFQKHDDVYLIDSIAPVQCVVIPGVARAKSVAGKLQEKGFDVRAIVNPSVALGKERLRISLHLHNTIGEVDALLTALNTLSV